MLEGFKHPFKEVQRVHRCKSARMQVPSEWLCLPQPVLSLSPSSQTFDGLRGHPQHANDSCTSQKLFLLKPTVWRAQQDRMPRHGGVPRAWQPALRSSSLIFVSHLVLRPKTARVEAVRPPARRRAAPLRPELRVGRDNRCQRMLMFRVYMCLLACTFMLHKVLLWFSVRLRRSPKTEAKKEPKAMQLIFCCDPANGSKNSSELECKELR